MHWSLVVQRWDSIGALLKQRFPRLCAQDLLLPPASRDALVRLLAECNDLTLFEAGEELEDVLRIDKMVPPLPSQLH